jgi:predicted TIM-barrel fold metal-dependent hydrolase
VETVGAGQVVFGTDYPHVIGDVARGLETLHAVGLGEQELSGIEAGNAARDLGFGPP